MAARLDYAFLAEYARVDAGGLLTAVGANFERITAPALPTQQAVTVVCRIQFDEGGERTTQFEAAFTGPHNTFDIKLGGDLYPEPAAKPFQGTIGTFAIVSPVLPLLAYGDYKVELALDGAVVRTMHFVVQAPEQF